MLDTVLLFILTISPLLVILPIIFLPIFIATSAFKKTEYAKITNNQYLRTRSNKGLYGEYLIYSYLKDLNSTQRFLFNVYLPKSNGETTEIDVLLINSSGIFVFESKNYDGWIFGTESQRQWTQSMPNGQKNRFYNPIMQNETHIKWLKSMLREYDNVPYHSVIAFSNRCTLKKIELNDNKASVINRNYVRHCVEYTNQQHKDVLNDEQIQQIYEKLYPYTQVTEEFKQKHISDIKNKAVVYTTFPVEAPTPVIEEPLPLVIETSVSEESVVKKKICSKCGCEMVLRTAKTGENAGKQFWGCSRFPKCRNAVNVET